VCEYPKHGEKPYTGPGFSAYQKPVDFGEASESAFDSLATRLAQVEKQRWLCVARMQRARAEVERWESCAESAGRECSDLRRRMQEEAAKEVQDGQSE